MTELLGKRIAALRSTKGLNQKQLAEKLNISPSAIGMYEQGRREPSLALIVEMAKYFPSQPIFFSPDVQQPQRQKIMLHCSN